MPKSKTQNKKKFSGFNIHLAHLVFLSLHFFSLYFAVVIITIIKYNNNNNNNNNNNALSRVGRGIYANALSKG